MQEILKQGSPEFSLNSLMAITAIWRFEVITHVAIYLTLAHKYF